MPYGPDTALADVIDDHQATAVIDRHLPGVLDDPELQLLPFTPLGNLPRFVRRVGEPAIDPNRMWQELAELPASPAPVPPAPEPPRPDYEPADVRPGSAELSTISGGEQWGTAEIAWRGPAHGNPFVDVDLQLTVQRGPETIQLHGFYDGDGIYRARFHPTQPGRWAYRTRSNARSLDGLSGTFDVAARSPSNHGRVVVSDTWHFSYADGTPYLPLGTTAYAWTHQTGDLQQATLNTLAGSGFTKLRMCLFPKSYHYNSNEPALFPYLRDIDGTWDFTRFNVEYFQHLDTQIQSLQRLGVEADLILFHSYDRWGFSQMPAWADQLITAYVVRRLAAYPGVWWSLANEYDFMRAKTEQDWEGIGTLIHREDHAGHLISIHNGFLFYDHTRTWITHCSIQSSATDRVEEWRNTYRKPVVIDEAGYEGDVAYGWGSVTAEEMVRRCWEGAIHGGYVNHGETYHDDDQLLWWSKGGTLHGQSPARIGFLANLIAETPDGRLEPLVGDWDLACGGHPDHRILYFGNARPRLRELLLPDGAWTIDVVDTWAMTVDTLPGSHTGRLTVELPGRPYLAIRLRADTPQGHLS